MIGSTTSWVEIATAGVLVGLLALLAVGLAFFGLSRRRGPKRPMGLFWNRIEALAMGARSFVEVDHLDPQQTLTFHAIIQRGWSPELMQEVLGRPDYAVLDPQRKRDPLKLYDRSRVERAEKGKKFRQHRAKVANEQARTEARIRKWLELNRQESDDAEAARHHR